MSPQSVGTVRVVTDRYEVIDVVGAGGMATVWRARDRELGRMVAIKRPHPAPADSTIHERFRREARAAAAVSHPNLVTVYDAAVDDEGPYLVMELVDAPSLADSKVEPGDAVKIGASLARALAALHAADIVHRDIKPSNILLAPGGAQLTDFGIARSLDATDDVTQAGVNFGTPSYAPPETLAGGAHDEAGDVYSLAVVVHEMFTGERFANASGTQVMITDRFLRPVLEPALAPDPAERPTAAAFADALGAIPGSAFGADSTQAIGSNPDATDDGVESDAPPIDMIGASVTSAFASDLGDRWKSADSNSRWLLVLLGSCAALAVILLAVGLTRGSSDSDAQPVAAQEPVAGDAETQGEAANQEPPPTPDPALQAIATARTAFDDYIANLDDDALKDKERDKVVDDVAAAIDDAAAGELDDAQGRFESASKRLSAKVSDDGARDESLRLLNDLAASVGVPINT